MSKENVELLFKCLLKIIVTQFFTQNSIKFFLFFFFFFLRNKNTFCNPITEKGIEVTKNSKRNLNVNKLIIILAYIISKNVR